MEVIDIVQQMGPCSTHEIAKELIAKTACKPDAARQTIFRAAGGELQYLGNMRLTSGSRLFYTLAQKQLPTWHINLAAALMRDRCAYGNALLHVVRNGGLIQESRLHTVCGFPLQPRKGRKHWTDGLEAMILDGVVGRQTDAELGACIGIGDFPGHVAAIRARFKAERALACAIREFLRGNGFVGHGTATVRHCGEDAEFGGYGWDLTGPSYILPYVADAGGTKPKPGFWAVDCLLGSKLSLSDIQYFLSKIGAIRAHRQIRPFTPVLVANGFEEDAFAAGRKAGAVMATPTSLFGRTAGESFRMLMEVLSNPAAIAKTKPGLVADVGQRLMEIDGAMGNLHGDIFELICAVALMADVRGSITMNRVIRGAGNAGVSDLTDIDVEVVTQEKVYIVQCKCVLGKRQIEADEVRDWYRNKVGRIRDARCAAYDQRREVHCFWTNGKFSSSAQGFLEEHKEKCKKYDVDWKDRDEMAGYLLKHRNKALVDILDRLERTCHSGERVKEEDANTK